jgi:hypothetical protein
MAVMTAGRKFWHPNRLDRGCAMQVLVGVDSKDLGGRGVGADGSADHWSTDQKGSSGRDSWIFVEGVLWVVRAGFLA